MRETIPPALDGQRVDRVVALLTGLSRAEVAALVDNGGVRLEGQPVAVRSRRVAEGDELEVNVPEAPVAAPLEPDPTVPFEVAHADADVIVVDKPAGVVVHPGARKEKGTLVHGLLSRFPDVAASGAGEPHRPGIVHRLDRGTSGLMVVARTPASHLSLVDQLKRRSVERRYLALVWGRVAAESGLVDAPVGPSAADPTRMAVSAPGRQARTRYQVLARFEGPAPVTLAECRLETGRTHQVRVHMAAIGHPLVGDERYGGRRLGPVPERPFLHAHRLAFDHPGTGERLSFESALPPDLEAVRRQLV
ncbi:MAG TPA: RluA family pseudouridine synthase [Acidimicrobiales bacterium]|nr:RluA family pseudouridine synthase [Acidimicrobiales bacterium]